ncbi:MAG: hypothetical protein ACRD3E_00505 [Terriglobales bacterium]
MKRLFPAITAFVLLFAMAAWAGDSTMTGWIVDKNCGAKSANAGAKACTQSCIKRGAPAVFVNDANKEVIAIHNQDAVKGHEGDHVKVTGEMMDGALHVDKVADASAK